VHTNNTITGATNTEKETSITANLVHLNKLITTDYPAFDGKVDEKLEEFKVGGTHPDADRHERMTRIKECYQKRLGIWNTQKNTYDTKL
jgi:hypothetical protein